MRRPEEEDQGIRLREKPRGQPLGNAEGLRRGVLTADGAQTQSHSPGKAQTATEQRSNIVGPIMPTSFQDSVDVRETRGSRRLAGCPKGTDKGT